MKYADAEFRWNEWNIHHIARHGVSPAEAEEVVRRSGRGYPRRVHDRFLVRGRTVEGAYLQVAFVPDPPPSETVYVIHARPLTAAEVRRYFPGRQRRNP